MSQTRTLEGNYRTVILTMDLQAGNGMLERLLTYLLTFAGGAGGLELIKRWMDRRKRQAEEPVELTARILDDGDRLRGMLLEEVKRVGTERDLAVERAHKAELQLAVLSAEASRLTTRLERKDEQNKALANQVINLGAVPVVVAPVTKEEKQ